MTRLPGFALVLAGQLVLGLVALRHHLFWGAGHEFAGVPLHVWLNVGEALGLALAAALGGVGWLRLVRAAENIDEPALVRAGIAFAAVACLVPPLLSTDVFDYLARGHLAVHLGHNPYTTPPGTVPQDAMLAAADWPHYVFVYGPLALATACVAALGSCGKVWIGAYLFKAFMAAAHVGSGLLIARASVGPQRRTMLALWLFHPFLAMESCGSGHNDALMALALAWMVERLARDRWAMATFAFGLAVLTKHGCAPLGPILLVAALRQGRGLAFAKGCAASLALAAACAMVLWREEGALGFLGMQAANRGASIQAFAAAMFGEEAAALAQFAGFGLALLAVGVACLAARDAASFARAGIAAMAVFLLTGMALFSPWYHLWWAPLVGLLPLADPRVHALRLLAWAGPAAYLVWAATRELTLPHQVWTWLVAGALPLFWLLRPAPRQDAA